MKRIFTFLVIFILFSFCNVSVVKASENEVDTVQVTKVKLSKSDKKAKKDLKKMEKYQVKKAKKQAKNEMKVSKAQAKENAKLAKQQAKEAKKALKTTEQKPVLDKKQAKLDKQKEKSELKAKKNEEKINKANEKNVKRLSKNKNMDPNFVAPSPYIKSTVKRHFLNPNLDVYEVRASHILVKKRKDAIMIRKDILNGDITFEEAAQRYSLCPSGRIGGDLGFFTRRKMEQQFADTAFDLEVGEISMPVGTKFGWHIIKTTDKR